MTESDGESRSPTGLSAKFKSSLTFLDKDASMDWQEVTEDENGVKSQGSETDLTQPEPVNHSQLKIVHFLVFVAILLGIWFRAWMADQCHSKGELPSISGLKTDLSAGDIVGQSEAIAGIIGQLEAFNSTGPKSRLVVLNGTHGLGKSLILKRLKAFAALKINRIDMQELVSERQRSFALRLRSCVQDLKKGRPSRIVAIDHANICGGESSEDDRDFVSRFLSNLQPLTQDYLVFVIPLSPVDDECLDFVRKQMSVSKIIQFRQANRSMIRELVSKLSSSADAFEPTLDYVYSVLGLSCENNENPVDCEKKVSESGFRRVPVLCEYRQNSGDSGDYN